jgi:hypothetical protein
MIDRECPSCGDRTFVFAKACPHCGAPSEVRIPGMMAAGSLVLLLVAVVVAFVVVLRGYRLAAATTTGVSADEQIVARSKADFGWLTSAMNACETEAKTDLGRLRFLVIPLAAVAKDDQQWRAKSINDIGNAILLRSDDALDGLKSRTLRLYPADYDFRVLDQATNTVYKWRASDGVAKFSTHDSGSISLFKVQFATAHSGSDVEWGSAFVRQDGTCYWVNAIIGN